MTSDPCPLAGVPVVITGSTRGLGRAFAEALAVQGADVIVNGTTSDSTQAAVDDMRRRGLSVSGLAGSVADHDFCERLIARCVNEYGSIGMLVNNAGITRDRSVCKMTVEEFDDVLAVNLRGTWSCGSAAARAMRHSGGGRILNITSGSGLFGMFGQANYASAKAGIVGLTRVMDLELQRYGIAVNCLAPVADTDMTGVFESSTVVHALSFPPPEAVAPVVAYLATADSSVVHGQCLSFDGAELCVWSHPRVITSVTREGWSGADFATSLADEACLDRPHPDRWGRGTYVP